MNTIRYVLLIILIMIFSWPVIIHINLAPWLMWLYPFTIWVISILMAFFFGEEEKNDRYQAKDKPPKDNPAP